MTPLSKKLIIALVVSVAVNLLLGGVLVGAAIQRHRMRAERAMMMPPRGFGPHEAGPRNEERSERAERKQRDRREGREGREGRGPRRGPMFGGLLSDELRPRREAMAKARGDVHEALVHEPFDPAALERSLTTFGTETVTTQDLLHKRIVELSKKDAETRAKLARGFEPRGAPRGAP
ncbi:MAG TPA: periplasmic heavy metal sensor [Polyangiaceae bacterium]|nr:periplasmic heavy metal sensor [Polyangiaceae bacterium]